MIRVSEKSIMSMERRDIFKELDMGEYIWGNAYVYSVFDLDLSIETNRFLKLDEICKTENWKLLGDSWNSLDFSACSEMLMDSIEFDIAYSSARITPEEIARKFHTTLLQDFKESDCHCYSNWFNNHWRSKEFGSSWNSLTENTFDLSTVFVTRNKILITCFRSED
ncbi:hypothetical protein WBG78_19390 [Chryseolinea sp. T2]|uniref:hypothetical protein n=1 Tax=Chryseolinea sp. T2 TaxID=3129255 RepID=UPI0030769895